ncbi:MAG TPA: hypothetical protein VF003_16590 [Pseudonocardiaceae bacterium]
MPINGRCSCVLKGSFRIYPGQPEDVVESVINWNVSEKVAHAEGINSPKSGSTGSPEAYQHGRERGRELRSLLRFLGIVLIEFSSLMGTRVNCGDVATAQWAAD